MNESNDYLKEAVFRIQRNNHMIKMAKEGKLNAKIEYINVQKSVEGDNIHIYEYSCLHCLTKIRDVCLHNYDYLEWIYCPYCRHKLYLRIVESKEY